MRILTLVKAQGSPITGYKLSVLMNGETTNFNVSLKDALGPILLPNLTAGATAIVSYAGCNVVGCGAYSETESVYLAGTPFSARLPLPPPPHPCQSYLSYVVAIPPPPTTPVGFVVEANTTEQTLEVISNVCYILPLRSFSSISFDAKVRFYT